MALKRSCNEILCEVNTLKKNIWEYRGIEIIYSGLGKMHAQKRHELNPRFGYSSTCRTVLAHNKSANTERVVCFFIFPIIKNNKNNSQGLQRNRKTLFIQRNKINFQKPPLRKTLYQTKTLNHCLKYAQRVKEKHGQRTT